jgi:hypothetical protein
MALMNKAAASGTALLGTEFCLHALLGFLFYACLSTQSESFINIRNCVTFI